MTKLKGPGGMACAAFLPLLFFAYSLLSCAMPEPPERIALLYGVSQYIDNKGEGESINLMAPDDDVRAMKAGLTERGWEVFSRINNEATKSKIKEDIKSFRNRNAVLLFYFSGHGIEASMEAAIVPYGAATENSININECIFPDELFSYFTDAGLKHVIIIMDSCFSGAFVPEGPSIDAVPPIFGPNDGGYIKYSLFLDAGSPAMWQYLSYKEEPSFVVLSAAGSEELSWEAGISGNPTSWHGIFTLSILHAMENSKADIDRDGYLSTGELFSYSKDFINLYWNLSYSNYFENTVKQYRDFHPHVSGSAREYILWEVK